MYNLKMIKKGYELIDGKLRKSCNENQERNIITGRCRKIVIAKEEKVKKEKVVVKVEKKGYEIIYGKLLKSCNENQERNIITGRCRKIVISKEVKKVEKVKKVKKETKISSNKILSKSVKCENILLSYDGNNSCYLDSLLASLFTSDHKYVYDLFFNTEIDNSNNELHKLATDIRKELYNIYSIISHKNNTDVPHKCKLIRKMMNDYKNAYNIYNPNNTIDQNDWQRVQSEPVQTLEFFDIIFKFKDTTDIQLQVWGSNTQPDKNTMIHTSPITNRREKSSFIHRIECNIADKILDLSSHIPSNINITEFNNDNLWNVRKNNSSIQYKYKIDELTIINSQLLFVHINRIIYDYSKDRHVKSQSFAKIKNKITLGNGNSKSLHSIIIHNGQENGGHYICLFKCNNKWYEFDDLRKDIKLIGTFTEISKNINYMTNCTDLIYI